MLAQHEGPKMSEDKIPTNELVLKASSGLFRLGLQSEYIRLRGYPNVRILDSFMHVGRSIRD